MIKKSCLLILLVPLIVISPLWAQVDQQAKITLSNGVKIKGGIVKSFTDELLEVNVQQNSENIFIRFDHIKKISFKNYGHISSDFSENLNNPPSLGIKSFYHELRGGLLFGEENVAGTIHTINGYLFSRYLGTGLGVGLNKFGNYLTVPLYATAKGYLSDKRVSPFYFADVGYGMAWQTDKNDDIFQVDNIEGGVYWQIGLGYQINFYNSSLTFALGYINQHSKADYIYYDPWSANNVEVSESRILRRFAFTVGFLL